ncbi:Hypothetical predicted protein [Octopus vulgaris]|uniref:Uncharacterized protein n=1 Tax=Octopus vulgaris TaxID=6645 RepID=A0AA36FK98_OCTVU|nr:Hypothetical predicted protein [Octopus vulgaris]
MRVCAVVIVLPTFAWRGKVGHFEWWVLDSELVDVGWTGEEAVVQMRGVGVCVGWDGTWQISSSLPSNSGVERRCRERLGTNLLSPKTLILKKPQNIGLLK